ncbi:hypothetical protein H7198_00410 [Fructobacillus sp. CRL 2054]|uniref:MARVEL domain-containing protein n=1 Tax=Fructobacillus sp. CRL 2054 TaxID=2763007 RepID=UPI002378B32E|nr:MARVEL domain-containing protein [Fructobacillus sp. CRL 2054]MDD9138076.1 hypothetical protein [Fructobacillus sp. CRL 2054]
MDTVIIILFLVWIVAGIILSRKEWSNLKNQGDSWYKSWRFLLSVFGTILAFSLYFLLSYNTKLIIVMSIFSLCMLVAIVTLLIQGIRYQSTKKCNNKICYSAFGLIVVAFLFVCCAYPHSPFENLELGMNKQEVIKVLGKPKKEEKNTLFYKGDEAGTLYFTNGKLVDGQSRFITEKIENHMKNDIKLGMTEQQVEDILGPADSKEENVLVYSTDKKGQFYFEDGKLIGGNNKIIEDKTAAKISSEKEDRQKTKGYKDYWGKKFGTMSENKLAKHSDDYPFYQVDDGTKYYIDDVAGFAKIIRQDDPSGLTKVAMYDDNQDNHMGETIFEGQTVH